jgi:hypothetical protein
MKLSNKLYDVLKWIDLVFIPALIVFYGVIGNVLNIPYTEITLTIMGAFDVFLGSLLGISSTKYAKESDEDGK